MEYTDGAPFSAEPLYAGLACTCKSQISNAPRHQNIKWSVARVPVGVPPFFEKWDPKIMYILFWTNDPRYLAQYLL